MIIKDTRNIINSDYDIERLIIKSLNSGDDSLIIGMCSGRKFQMSVIFPKEKKS